MSLQNVVAGVRLPKVGQVPPVVLVSRHGSHSDTPTTDPKERCGVRMCLTSGTTGYESRRNAQFLRTAWLKSSIRPVYLRHLTTAWLNPSIKLAHLRHWTTAWLNSLIRQAYPRHRTTVGFKAITSLDERTAWACRDRCKHTSMVATTHA